MPKGMHPRLRAKAYAKALLALACERNVLSEWRKNLGSFQAEMPKELWSKLDDPRIPQEVKVSWLAPLLDATFPTGRVLLEQLLRVHSLGLVPLIVEAFNELADEVEGILRVTVETVIPLTEATRERLIKKLTKRYGCKVELEACLKPELRGGMRLISKQEILDGSLQRRLQELRWELRG